MIKLIRQNPPVASKRKMALEAHERVRLDYYYWMNNRESPEVIDYLNAENDYLKAVMAPTEALQRQLFDEMKGRIKEDDESVPYFKNGYFYYNRYEIGSEYPIYCRKLGNLTAREEIMLDVNELGKDFAYYHVGSLGVSQDQRLLCYSYDAIGRRIYNLAFKHLTHKETLRDQLTDVTGNFSWANDSQTIFYAKQDPETLRSHRIYKHRLGTSQEDDVLVYEEVDDAFTCFVRKSKSQQYLYIVSQSTVSTEYRVLPADQPDGEWKLVQLRERDLEYELEHVEGYFYILTNAFGAKNFQLMRAPVEDCSKSFWEEFIPHRENVLLEGMEVFKNHLVLEERFFGLGRLQIRSWDGLQKHYIKMDEPVYTVWVGQNAEYYTNILRFGYNSLCTPSSIFDYDMDTRSKILMKQQEVVGGYDAKDYLSERCWGNAPDGTEIPISLVYKKELFRKDGSNPLLLYAYGSYGYSTDPTFSSNRLSLLDRGFVYAIAHVRGGQEMGRYWYEDGKMLRKKNTFSDFITCAEYLTREKYTDTSRLFAMGGSAGGLLMGVVINERPDLFKGVVAAVPFVDVVTTMLDESIPLTTGEFDEWGNPKEKTYYDYMLSYSPYDNVTKQAYPNLLVISGLHDSQVQYWEPTKWVAKLREYKTDENFLLLYTNMVAGHGGASGRFRALKELAMEYAFLISLVE
ncbi:S9 family peptidase [Lunatimonas salinarum]|uniref:S9 family peptidase n=1 Tax=Lunatimonas salinarum TaxID=1774590 RepID=UPI001AE026CC|nr:S9 family peptidase [Lunatimonas salinarum]